MQGRAHTRSGRLSDEAPTKVMDDAFKVVQVTFDLARHGVIRVNKEGLKLT